MSKIFDHIEAEIAINFIQRLKHGDGDWYGQPFTLIDWQLEAVSQFYGTLQDNSDIRKRKYQYLYLEIPKKNGKSELAAALGLYHTFLDGERGGEVYICAADKDNASIIFNVALSMIEQNADLQGYCRIVESQRKIIDLESKTVMKVMSSEAYSKHGYKPSCVIFDELHSQPNRNLWDIMTFGAGSSRRQPVWIVLTTAGDDPDRKSIGWEIHEYARKVLRYRQGETENIIEDPVWLPYIFGAPQEEEELKSEKWKPFTITNAAGKIELDIFNETVWKMANPSLGITLSYDTLRQEALAARNSSGTMKLFKWLRLNMWVSLKATSWIPLFIYDKNEGEWSRDSLIGKKCYLGFDLGSTVDLTGIVAAFPPQDGFSEWRIIFKGYMPSEKLEERKQADNVPYDKWIEAGYLDITPGDATDYEYIIDDILTWTGLYEVIMMGGDRWNSDMLVQYLQKLNDNLEIITISQDVSGMSQPMKMIEILLRHGQMSHEKNDLARWCFGNVKTYVDGNENIKPMKNRSVGRIDISVAWINCIATAIQDGYELDLNAAIMDEEWSM